MRDWESEDPSKYKDSWPVGKISVCEINKCDIINVCCFMPWSFGVIYYTAMDN